MVGGLKKIFWPFGPQFGPKKREGGDPDPSPGSATAISLLWVPCQVRGSRLGGPRSPQSFFPFGFPSTSMELQHAGKKKTNEIKN